MKKQKCLNLEQKRSYLGIFGLEFQKIIVTYWSQHPWNCLIAQFREKIKMSKFVTKNVLFQYFCALILKKLVSYLKSTPLEMRVYIKQWTLVQGPLFLKLSGPLFWKTQFQVRVLVRFIEYAQHNIQSTRNVTMETSSNTYCSILSDINISLKVIFGRGVAMYLLSRYKVYTTVYNLLHTQECLGSYLANLPHSQKICHYVTIRH